MLNVNTMYRARQTARNARPEPHSRLTAAASSAEAFSNTTTPTIETELMTYIVDITEDTLLALINRDEVAAVDIANADRVLAAAIVIKNLSTSETLHLDHLIEMTDDLRETIRGVKLGRAD